MTVSSFQLMRIACYLCAELPGPAHTGERLSWKLTWAFPGRLVEFSKEPSGREPLGCR